MNFKQKKLLYFCLIFAQSFFLPNEINFTAANPIAVPDMFRNTQIGLENPKNTPIRLVQAKVEIDVYERALHGLGTYLLHNSWNQTVNLTLAFSSGSESAYAEISPIQGIMSNGTSISYILNYSDGWNGLQGCNFNLSFDPLDDIDLEIRWQSLSSAYYSSGWSAWKPIRQERQIYLAVYQINGGKYWNNTPIESEQVTFRFHTEDFLKSGNQVAVNTTSLPMNLTTYYNSEWDNGMGESFSIWKKMVNEAELIPTLANSEGYSEVTFNYSNIIDDIHIHIMNYRTGIHLTKMGFFYTSVLGPVGLLGLISTIMVYLVFKKKKGKDQVLSKKRQYKISLVIFLSFMGIGIVGGIAYLANPTYYDGYSVFALFYHDFYK